MRVRRVLVCVVSTVAMGCGNGSQTIELKAVALGAVSNSEELLIMTSPGASCELTSNGANAPRSSLNADDFGFLRIHVDKAATTNGVGGVPLDCALPQGGKAQYSVDIDQARSLQGAYRQMARQPPPKSRTRAPLPDDPSRLTQAEIVSRGFPPRPDQGKAPGAYDRWLAIARKPATIIQPHLIEGPEPAYLTDTTQNKWSGVVLNNANQRIYLEIDGQWPVPAAAHNGAFGAVAAVWVGIDGWQSTDVAQCGTSSVNNVMYFHGMPIEFSTYFAWTEWAPGNPHTIANFPVSPGDTIYAYEWIGDGFGNPTLSGGFGWSQVYNATTNIVTDPIPESRPPNVSPGYSAEWIVERPFNPPAPLASYGTFVMDQAMAFDPSWNSMTYVNNPGFLVQMKSTSTNNLLSSAALGPNALEITFTFRRSQ